MGRKEDQKEVERICALVIDSFLKGGFDEPSDFVKGQNLSGQFLVIFCVPQWGKSIRLGKELRYRLFSFFPLLFLLKAKTVLGPPIYILLKKLRSKIKFKS